jgi:hypothetical protein
MYFIVRVAKSATAAFVPPGKLAHRGGSGHRSASVPKCQELYPAQRATKLADGVATAPLFASTRFPSNEQYEEGFAGRWRIDTFNVLSNRAAASSMRVKRAWRWII